MPESFLGEGLIFEDLLPLGWSPGPLPQDVVLARMNADNHQLLGTVSSLEEVRVNDALKDESQAILHELQRLEFKLNVLLRLTAELARQNSALPPSRHLRLSAAGLEWIGDDAPATGSTGVLDLFISSALPQALKLPATVIGTGRRANLPTTHFKFAGLSDPVIDQLEKLIFRHHRRLVATSRHSVPSLR